MQNRFYVVGNGVENLQTTFTLGVKTREIPQMELENSIYNQGIIRVFPSFENAKEYAYGQRHNAYDFTHYPKTAVSRSKVRPVITLDLASSLELGELKSETFVYFEHYVDETHQHRTREKEIELSFYEVDSTQLNKENMVRAEFFDSKMKPVEFTHETPANKCVIS